jgi:hypothetical protein
MCRRNSSTSTAIALIAGSTVTTRDNTNKCGHSFLLDPIRLRRLDRPAG